MRVCCRDFDSIRRRTPVTHDQTLTSHTLTCDAVYSGSKSQTTDRALRCYFINWLYFRWPKFPLPFFLCPFYRESYTYMNSSNRPSTIGIYLTGTTRLWLNVFGLFACILFCYILYCILSVVYCNMVLWSWCNWNLGWVIWPVKILLLTSNRLAVKTVSEMTYNMSTGTLNSTLPLQYRRCGEKFVRFMLVWLI